MRTFQTGCKINLGLKIVSKRSDGYHELDSIFYPLNQPCDTIQINKLETSDKLEITTSSPEIDPNNNTLTRCYKIWHRITAHPPALAINLIKDIPIGAGLGGGSSDAACLLKFLNSELEQPLTDAKLNNVAKEIGADVPFFLNPKPSRIQGIGEIITPVDLDLSAYTLILVTPNFKIDTPWAYNQFDAQNCAQKFDERYKSLTRNNFSIKYLLSAASKTTSTLLSFDNDLEQAVLPCYPPLQALKKLIFDLGAQAVAMSGSGSSIFGLFDKDPMIIANASQNLRSSTYRFTIIDL
ncbi:MAG: 4-(cytidine 5'-diphospho)-2-C-methyl-D-erythritol kinase [Desulfovibrionaceae bacterium]|nr:4-(cytidine 5'-diphospho)-2-C-methyl-D-erythritol kinase [Desulfovibrionaceae bacterium]